MSLIFAPRKTIYVAGPYTGQDFFEVEHNIQQAEQVGIELFALGWSPFIPHNIFSHWDSIERDGFTYENFFNAVATYLLKCDAVFFLDTYEKSKGAKKELEIANEYRIKKFFQKTGFPTLDQL